MRGRTTIAGRVALVVALAASPAAAARLHLEGGGVIDAVRVRHEGAWIYYDNGSGEIGLPRDLVLRIDEDEGPQAASPRRPADREPAAATRHRADGDDLGGRLRAANAALESRDFQAATDLYLDVLGDAPDLQLARVGYALAEMALGRDAMALSVVLDGLAREPDHPELNELLGDLRNREERVEDALRSWRAAFGKSPTDRVREKILKAERELSAGRDYDYAASSHFNVRFDGEVDKRLAAEVMGWLEDRYWDLADNYRHAPPQPITVLLYPTRAFREVTQSPEWVGGLYDGKIRVPLGGLRTLTERARSVLTHELTHAVVHSKTRGHCPRWLHEGLAQISEGRTLSPAQRREVAQLLAAGDPASWELRGFSYPAALSLTRFLEAERGTNGLVWVLDLLAEGQTVDEALRRTYGLTYEPLCRRWAEELLRDEGSR